MAQDHILAVLAENPQKWFRSREIAKKLRLEPSSLSQPLIKLRTNCLVSFRWKGQGYLYRSLDYQDPDPEPGPLFQELNALNQQKEVLEQSIQRLDEKRVGILRKFSKSIGCVHVVR